MFLIKNERIVQVIILFIIVDDSITTLCFTMLIYNNRKNGTKISLITDSNGIPFNVKCYKGNKYDSKILDNHLKNENLIDITNMMPDKKYFLADPGYDTKAIRDNLKDKNYLTLIPQNAPLVARNIKDKNKLKKFSKMDKKIYKKRLVIERTFNNLKVNRRLCLRYESYLSNFIGFIYLALIKILC